MRAYTDETYYINDYLKGRKPVITAGFLFYARSASQVIDRYTFNHLKGVSDVPEEVQMCCCELSESEYHREKIGTYSVGFASAQESATAISREQRSIIMKWLAHTGLCYQGV